MSIKNLYQIYYNEDVIDKEVKNFVAQWHYSKSTRSQQQKHVFKLINNYNELVGVIIYGKPMCRHYDNSIIELRRMCLIDDTPRNTESYFISQTIKWLRRNTDYETIISFADPNKGHIGTIYKASNFEFTGEENNNPRVVQYGEKQYHLRQFYEKKDGEYSSSALRLQAAVEKGEAEIIKQERKLRYEYKL